MINIFKSSLIKNISSLGLIQLGNYIIPLLIVPYISRVIGIEKYGELEYARTIVFYFSIFIDYGFNLTSTREISIHRNDKNKINEIVTNTYIAKLILFLASLIVFIFVLNANDSLFEISLLLSVTFLINIGNLLFPIWYFQGIEKIAKIAYINFGIKLITLFSVVFFIKEINDYWKYNLFLSLAQILIGIYALYELFYKFNVSLVRFSLKSLKLIFKNSFNVFLSTILVTVFVSYGFLLLKETGTSLEVGSYSTANKLAMTIQVLILLPFSQAFFPYIANKVNDGIDEFEKIIKKAFILILSTTFIIGITSYLLSDLIILIIFGEEYLVASEIFKIMAFLPIFTILNNLFCYQGLLSLKKDKLFLHIHIVFSILIVGISYFFIPIFGVKGLALIRVISEIFLMSVSYYFLRKTIKTIKNESFNNSSNI